MIRRQFVKKFFIKCCGTLLLIRLAAELVTQVALPFNVGILKMVCPGAQLSGAGDGQRFQI